MERNIQNHDIMELSYISENGAFDPHIFPIFEKVTFGAQIKKKWSEKSSCISGNRTFLYFLKKRFFYISGEEYSEP